VGFFYLAIHIFFIGISGFIWNLCQGLPYIRRVYMAFFTSFSLNQQKEQIAPESIDFPPQRCYNSNSTDKTLSIYGAGRHLSSKCGTIHTFTYRG
jgi:hypothetical protein